MILKRHKVEEAPLSVCDQTRSFEQDKLPDQEPLEKDAFLKGDTGKRATGRGGFFSNTAVANLVVFAASSSFERLTNESCKLMLGEY